LQAGRQRDTVGDAGKARPPGDFGATCAPPLIRWIMDSDYRRVRPARTVFLPAAWLVWVGFVWLVIGQLVTLLTVVERADLVTVTGAIAALSGKTIVSAGLLRYGLDELREAGVRAGALCAAVLLFSLVH
jgi:hypothetical protein